MKKSSFLLTTLVLLLGCSVVKQQPCAYELNIETRTFDTDCRDDSGTIIIQVSGGAKPYKYSWSHDKLNKIHEASELKAGLYSITITDKNGLQQVTQCIVN